MKSKYMNNYWMTRGTAAAAVGLMLSGCGWFIADIDDKEVTEMDNELKTSSKTTVYDKSLRDFGKMLDAYNISKTRVQSKLISNQTSEKSLPDDVSRMLISAVNKVGDKIIYVPYDPNYVLSEAQTGGNIKRALPQIVLAGGITEFDKDMIEKSRRLRSEVSIQEGDYGSKYNHDGGAGYSAEGGVSRMTLDLQLMNYKTQTYIANVQSINQVNIRKTKIGWSIGYYFQGSGGAFEYELKKKQGKYHAIRLLVELSVLEVLGKYFDVPYWRCVEGSKPNVTMVNRMREEFADLSDTQQLSFLKEYLFFHGYPGLATPTGQLDQNILSSAMTKWQCKNKTDLFMKLWETVPIMEARKRNFEYKRNAAKLQQQEYRNKVAQYNQLISRGDSLYRAKQLRAARSCYLQARRIFPDQKDPVLMIARIDNDLQSLETASPAPPTATAPVVAVSTPAPTPVSQPTKTKNGKEAPLNPFKKVSW